LHPSFFFLHLIDSEFHCFIFWHLVPSVLWDLTRQVFFLLYVLVAQFDANVCKSAPLVSIIFLLLGGTKTLKILWGLRHTHIEPCQVSSIDWLIRNGVQKRHGLHIMKISWHFSSRLKSRFIIEYLFLLHYRPINRVISTLLQRQPSQLVLWISDS
jgi:hypothetical protein